MVLAHQGGWDEALVVLVPLVIIALVLVLANRRVRHRSAPPPAGAGDHGDHPGTDRASDRDR